MNIIFCTIILKHFSVFILDFVARKMTSDNILLPNESRCCLMEEVYNLSTDCLSVEGESLDICHPKINSSLLHFAGIWCIINVTMGFSGNLLTPSPSPLRMWCHSWMTPRCKFHQHFCAAFCTKVLCKAFLEDGWYHHKIYHHRGKIRITSQKYFWSE